MAEILIYGEIGPEEWRALGGDVVSSKWVKQMLDSYAGETEITVRINSLGGDVFEGLAIYNLLAEHPAKISVKVDSVAASAASFIAMAGDSVEMARNSKLMIHKPFTGVKGNADAMRKVAEILDELESSIVDSYVLRTGMAAEDLGAMMREEKWINAQSAVEMGFADSVSENGFAAKHSGKRPANTIALRMPEEFGATRFPVQALVKEPEPEVVAEFRIAARARFPIS